VGISAIRMDDALQAVSGWIRNRQAAYVCVCPVSTVMAAHDDAQIRQLINQAGLATPDGMPLVWICKLLGQRQTRRVYGPDLMLAVCELSGKTGYTHYLFGGNPGVPELLRDRLVARFPGLAVVGVHSPPFGEPTADEDEQMMQMINAANPDIVWVGLSSPKQDRWMAQHRARLGAPVLIGVGAAFDFFSGRVRQAPYWMQRSGLEWLFRLSQEPQRLWRRYLLGNTRFVFHIALQVTGLRRYTL
jgi:N-acetylglucosaminyldiphosphoundecaprenol N-acetyl-beta-D-mannosaminyltransferase